MPARLDRPTTRVNIRLFTEDYDFLTQLCAGTTETPTSLIRHIAELYVRRQQAEMLERAKAMIPGGMG